MRRSGDWMLQVAIPRRGRWTLLLAVSTKHLVAKRHRVNKSFGSARRPRLSRRLPRTSSTHRTSLNRICRISIRSNGSSISRQGIIRRRVLMRSRHSSRNRSYTSILLRVSRCERPAFLFNRQGHCWSRCQGVSDWISGETGWRHCYACV